ncbi:hypothetical protein ES705_22648 [subsurface metagenome]
MTFKSLEPERIERIRDARRLGGAIETIAKEMGVSAGAVSKYTRDIPKPVEVPVVNKGVKSVGGSSAILRITGKVPPDEATIRAINEADQADAEARKVDAETRKVNSGLARQVALDEMEDRKQQRRRVFDLEVKKQEAEVREAETRAKLVVAPSPELSLQLEQARSETARLERELTEQRHQEGLAELQRGFQGEIAVLSRQLASISRAGLGSYDIMSQAMSKVENLAMLAGTKVDLFVRDNRTDRQLGIALSLGLSPGEYEVYRHGPEVPLTKQQFMAYRGEEDPAGAEEAYRRNLAFTQEKNYAYEVVSAKVARRLQGGGPARAKSLSGREGHVPVPGEPEPSVLKAEPKLVKCQRCGTVFDVDLAAARQEAVLGKKLFVACPNPKCGFLLDITSMIPELAMATKLKPERPACYAGTQEGCNNKGSKVECDGCPWRDAVKAVRDAVKVVYE